MSTLVICALAGIVVAAPTAKNDVSSIVSKISKAPQSVSYSGVKVSKVFLGKGSVSAEVKVSHKKPALTRIQILNPTRLNGTVFIRRYSSIYRRMDNGKKWLQIADSSNAAHDEDAAVLWNYHVKVIGEATIANRKSIVLYALPKSKEDLRKRIWVDKHTYIIIKQEALAPDGRVVHSSQYKSITFKPTFSADEFAVNGKIIVQRIDSPYFPVAIPKYVPKGYKIARKGYVIAGGRRCYHFYYVNGVSGISIFQRPLDKDEYIKKMSSNQGGNIMAFEKKRMGFVIVGDVSMREIERIATSINP